MDQWGYQKRYKSGACVAYFDQFGVQDDPRVNNRRNPSRKDRVMNAMAAMLDGRKRREKLRASIKLMKAEQAAKEQAKLNQPAGVSIMQRFIGKLKSLTGLLRKSRG